jgi:hypothetical protein
MGDIQGTLNSFSNGVNDLQKGFNNVFQQPTKIMNYLPDTSALLGPVYDYSGEIPSPQELGIKMGNGSAKGIARGAAGIDYYAGTIGYGKSVGLSQKMKGMKDQHPLGLNFFLKTGATCSNGEPMYEYVSTIPKGIPGELGDKLAKEMKGFRFQGLAPGIVNDAGAALNPAPFFNAAIGSGFAKCKQITKQVGDYNGKLKSDRVKGRPWIDPSKETITTQKNKDRKRRKDDPKNRSYTTHWVFDKWISADEYNAERKGGTGGGNTGKRKKGKKSKKKIVETVEDFYGGDESDDESGYESDDGDESVYSGEGPVGGSTVGAGVLFAALFLGLVAFSMARK